MASTQKSKSSSSVLVKKTTSLSKESTDKKGKKLASKRRKKTIRRGRPRGLSQDRKSYGPLADLIRRKRIAARMGLSEVAKACHCSVQFISNIEHGRAPLPWEKAEKICQTLNISMHDLQAANLAIRSDFQKFAAGGKLQKKYKSIFPSDPEFQNLVQRYLSAPADRRKQFINQAKEWI